MTDYTTSTWPTDRWPNFSFAELRCSHTGRCGMSEVTMDRLQDLRGQVGKPLTITSGYRYWSEDSHKSHPVEAKKSAPGSHAKGRAVDIAVSGPAAYEVLLEALIAGFTGIGISQKGDGRFLHFDDLKDGEHSTPRPTIWSY